MGLRPWGVAWKHEVLPPGTILVKMMMI